MRPGALERGGPGRIDRVLPWLIQFCAAELQDPPATEKEALLRRLVALLEEEAEVINQKVIPGKARGGSQVQSMHFGSLTPGEIGFGEGRKAVKAR